MVASTDGRGFTTTFEYDALGRQTAMVDPLGGREPANTTPSATSRNTWTLREP